MFHHNLIICVFRLFVRLYPVFGVNRSSDVQHWIDLLSSCMMMCLLRREKRRQPQFFGNRKAFCLGKQSVSFATLATPVRGSDIFNCYYVLVVLGRDRCRLRGKISAQPNYVMTSELKKTVCLISANASISNSFMIYTATFLLLLHAWREL